MTNLFVTEHGFEKTANTKLDSDHTRWVKQIITNFLTQFPMLQDQEVSVQWVSKDVEKGTAVGALKVAGGTVPVIINNYELSALDVILMNGRVYPLTQLTIQELMTKTDPFKGVAQSPPKGVTSLFSGNAQYSPVESVFNSASGTERPAKYASFIEKVSSVSRDDVVSMLKEINEDRDLRNNFITNGHEAVLEKLAGKEFMTEEGEMKNMVRNLPIDRQLVYSDDLGNRFVKQANSSVDYVWTTKISDSEEMSNLFAQDEETEKTASNVVGEEESGSMPKLGSYGA